MTRRFTTKHAIGLVMTLAFAVSLSACPETEHPGVDGEMPPDTHGGSDAGANEPADAKAPTDADVAEDASRDSGNEEPPPADPPFTGQLDKQSCPMSQTTTDYDDVNLTTTSDPTLLHPTVGAANADNTKIWAASAGRIFDIETGSQAGQLATGGNAANQQWSNLTPNVMYYVHSDGSFRRQVVYGGSGETTIFKASDVGYSAVISGPNEGLIFDDGDHYALFMGRVGQTSNAEIFIWDMKANKKLSQTQPVTWNAHDFISMTHYGQFAVVKSVAQGLSNGPWWFYPVTPNGIGARVVSEEQYAHHAGPATENGVDRWVIANGDVMDMATGKTIRKLCGFWSLGQHVHGVRGHDSVVGSTNGGRMSLVWVDGSGGVDLGPFSNSESYAQVTRNIGGKNYALFASGGRVVRRAFPAKQ